MSKVNISFNSLQYAMYEFIRLSLFKKLYIFVFVSLMVSRMDFLVNTTLSLSYSVYEIERIVMSMINILHIVQNYWRLRFYH